MALNFSHRPVFQSHISEDYLVQGGSQDQDIRELLPADPFGMDISSTVTALTGWLEDLGADYGGYGGTEVGFSSGDYPIFAGWNLWLNTGMDMEFQASPANVKTDDKIYERGVIGGHLPEEELGCSVYDGSDRFACSVEDVTFGTSNVSFHKTDNLQEEDTWMVCDTDDGAPHSALCFALTYLGVRDLLSVERVCKSLCFTVRNDPLLWRSIHIDQPLNDKVNDEVLLQLTNRAQGNLQCLSLIECQRVTDDGLRRVLESNLRLTKLSVPGCTRLSIDGVVSCLRVFKTVAVTGIKCLRIGGLFGVTQEHFEELTSILGIHNHVQANLHKPHFYDRGNLYLSCEDDRPLDIEMCPRCQNLRLVYDCPAESCQAIDHASQLCRACTLCILRCVQCGRCIKDGEYEETFCLELLCSDCWK